MYLIGIDPSTSLNGFYPIARIIVTISVDSQLIADFETFNEIDFTFKNNTSFDTSFDRYISRIASNTNDDDTPGYHFDPDTNSFYYIPKPRR